MSSALAIASVTAFLKNLLENGLVDEGINASIGGDAVVSALPPDRITTGTDERPQLNLFLHQVTPHTGLRPRERSDRRALLGLDLHYLLTAYGAQDFQIEILLGYAAQVMNRTPIVRRDVLAARFPHWHRPTMAVFRRRRFRRWPVVISIHRSIRSRFVHSTSTAKNCRKSGRRCRRAIVHLWRTKCRWC